MLTKHINGGGNNAVFSPSCALPPMATFFHRVNLQGAFGVALERVQSNDLLLPGLHPPFRQSADVLDYAKVIIFAGAINDSYDDIEMDREIVCCDAACPARAPQWRRMLTPDENKLRY